MKRTAERTNERMPASLTKAATSHTHTHPDTPHTTKTTKALSLARAAHEPTYMIYPPHRGRRRSLKKGQTKPHPKKLKLPAAVTAPTRAALPSLCTKITPSCCRRPSDHHHHRDPSKLAWGSVLLLVLGGSGTETRQVPGELVPLLQKLLPELVGVVPAHGLHDALHVHLCVSSGGWVGGGVVC